jgi:urease accessory protein
MLLAKEKIERDSLEFQQAIVTEHLTLPFEIRQKARFVANLDSGLEIGLQVERGQILRDGDKLRAVDGAVVQINAGDEAVSTVNVIDQKLISRVCYHLGNRHVQLQVEAGWCRYLQDHVLDEMVVLLGAEVTHGEAPFEPEAGAYAGGHKHHNDYDSSVHKVDTPESINDIESFTAIK